MSEQVRVDGGPARRGVRLDHSLAPGTQGHVAVRHPNPTTLEPSALHGEEGTESTRFAVVSGALAGGTPLAGNTDTAWAITVGAISTVGAIAAGLESKLGLQERAAAHQKAAISFGALGTSYYDVKIMNYTKAKGVQAIAKLTQQQSQLEERSILVEPRTVKTLARRRLLHMG
ncbi:hypothetical protein ACFWIA_23245 [Streptomyces sp. NPDC127068]|uniref:hypothetical protein n=1 Tax=Streptomyces sp. NPDC127068 TaxID=3347127 RepID=UPI0036627960